MRSSFDDQTVTRRAGLKSASALACARASADCVHVLSSFQRTEARLFEPAFPALAHCRDRLVQGNLPNLLRPSHCRQDFFSSRPASARLSFSQTRRPITQISSPRTENRRRLAEQVFREIFFRRRAAPLNEISSPRTENRRRLAEQVFRAAHHPKAGGNVCNRESNRIHAPQGCQPLHARLLKIL